MPVGVAISLVTQARLFVRRPVLRRSPPVADRRHGRDRADRARLHRIEDTHEATAMWTAGLLRGAARAAVAVLADRSLDAHGRRLALFLD